MKIENLRSPYVKTHGLFYFARMIDKIRLNAAKKLPEDFVANLGTGFDGRCVRFLQIDYPKLVKQTLSSNGSDEELLEWCFTQGRRPSEEEIEIWNGFMSKCGWKDAVGERLKFRLEEGGFSDRTDIQTMFDYIDLDEGRDPKTR